MSSPTTTSPTGSAGSGTRSRPLELWLRLVIVGLLGVVLGVPTLLFLIVMFGHLSGEELAPDTFQRRKFEYYEIPLLRLQVTPIYRSSATGSLESLLARRGYLRDDASSGQPATGASTNGQAAGPDDREEPGGKATTVKPAEESKPVDEGESKPGEESKPTDASVNDESLRWDLVIARRGQSVSARGDALILCQYLDSRLPDGQQQWQQWTEDHADLAAVVWPMVARLARQKMYVLVPEVLDLAEQGGKSEQLASELRAMLADAFWQLATAQQQQGRHQVALELITDGLAYVPDHARLLAARQESEAARNAPP